MAFNFIFMLTRDDRTVCDAFDHLQVALELGIKHIGFKDIGLPLAELAALNKTIKNGAATSYLEVVSLDSQHEVASAQAALEIGVDYLLGGTRTDVVLPVIAGSGIRYYPFVGRITGHPSVLEGTIDAIAAQARELAGTVGVHGLDLLAYRFQGNVDVLLQAVCAASEKPVIVAGSIESPEQIQKVRAAGAAGFTIGTAALNGDFPASSTDLVTQLRAITQYSKAF